MDVMLMCLFVTVTVGGASMQASRGSRYEDLVSLFNEWRSFQGPKLVGGVPDYTASAMAAQHRELASWQKRLATIDPSRWPIPQQVDWHVVRAEMNGLDFDHRVLKPWANNPAFYVTVFPEESDQPAREGPFAYGAVELWSYAFPLTAESAARIDTGIRAIAGLLEQAKKNLVGNGRDLWIYGAKSIRQQSADLAELASKLTDSAASLKADVEKARMATDDFAAWLDSQAASKTGPSGVGVENYDWYLKNVQLAPYTWRDEVTVMERELARAHALLAMEELRNAKLPEQAPVGSTEEYDRRFGAAVTEYMAYLRDHDILTVREWMDGALRARIGSFRAGPREFFSEVDYRDPELMRTHGYHWFDKGRMAHDPHPSPIRRGALLYNIFDTRTEGHATGWEELMMQAGMFDARPRTRELLYIALAQRAARALGDLRMHANEFTLEQAAEFACANTPRGWLRLDGNLVRGEQHLYLQQPTYGTSYVIGKIEIEKLLTERERQLGEGFTMKRFMDEFDAAGLVPASLLRWELSGKMPDDVRRMLRADAEESPGSRREESPEVIEGGGSRRGSGSAARDEALGRGRLAEPSGGGVATSRASDRDGSLWGSAWRLENLGGEDVIPGVEVTLEFPEAGKTTGKASCNRFAGSVEISGQSIEFGPLAATKMACIDAAANTQERKYLDALQKAERFTFDGPALLVYSKAIDRPLRFARK